MDQETQQKIQELQGMEQNLNNLVMQKQAFQMELTETENALSEISKSKDDVFKLVGNNICSYLKDERYVFSVKEVIDKKAEQKK